MSTDERPGPAEADESRGHGLLHNAVEGLLVSTRAVAGLLAHTGAAGAQAVLPDAVRAPVEHMLVSLRSVVEQAPHLGDELDVLAAELRAKRLTIQAVSAELAALDQQLEVLERTLAPVQAWSAEWERVQRALLSSLDHPRDESPQG